MNILLKISVVVFVITLLPFTTKAQDMKIIGGLGLSYTSDISSIGISAKGVYLINDTWEGAGSFTYLFESKYTKWSMLGLDAHYVFSSDDSKMFYALSGLNITFWKVELASEYGAIFGDSDISGSELGLNFGGGGRYVLSDKLNLFSEVKYTIGGFGFFTIEGGLMYNF